MIDISTRLKKISGKIPVALCYLVATSAFAQDLKEVQALQQRTDLRSLQLLRRLPKDSLSSFELQEVARKKNLAFEGKLSGGSQYQLQGFSKKTGKPIYYITYNKGAGTTTNTHQLHNLGGGRSLEGKGITLHEWDAGAVRVSHQEFGGRVTQMDGSANIDEHATHVAGTIVAAGVDESARGMAPKAKLHTYDWRSDTDEMAAAAAQGALVSNHSYGVPGGFQYGDYSGMQGWHWLGDKNDAKYTDYGKYGSVDALWDFIILKSPYYLPVKAAGNDRGSGPEKGGVHYYYENNTWKTSTQEREKNCGTGYDCINSGNLGKNSLIIGAAHKIIGGYTKASDVVLASFSSGGPTDDGRIKPDIVGVGMYLNSTGHLGNNLYGVLSGTSMASPNVTGSLGLLQELYKKLYGTPEVPFMKGATLKALAIHTANEAGEHPGPDYQFGWGLLNTGKAVQVLSDRNKYSIVEQNALAQDVPYTLKVKAKGEEPLVVTMAWDDAVPENSKVDIEGIDNRTTMLVNDLDVRVSDGTTEFQPWVLDPDQPRNAATKGDNFRDNVEQVVIENPVAGREYTITVKHKAGKRLKTTQIVDNQFVQVDTPSQDYSLIVTGIDKGVKKDLEINAINVPSHTQYTHATPVDIIVKNVASETINYAKVTYQLINKDDNDRVEWEGDFEVNHLAQHQEIKKTINFNLSKSFVNYSIEAKITSSEDEIKANDVLSVDVYGIVSDLTPANAQHHFSFEGDFEKNGWTVEDTDGNGISWRKYDNEYAAKTGKSSAYNNADMARGINDWIFSNPLRLKQNQPYKVILNVKKDNADIAEQVGVYIGQQAVSTAMTSIGTPIEVTTDYVRCVLDYTPTTDGIFYVGINNKTETNVPASSVFLDDVSIVQANGSPIVDFKASTKYPNNVEAVQLISEVVDNGIPVTHYEWTISPNHDGEIAFTEGHQNSAHPKLVFKKEGVYTIGLKVTNAKGETTMVKKDYIRAKNTDVAANYKGGGTFYQGNIVKFTDTSTGNPLPNRWKWTMTPSEEVEFVNGTSETSQSPEIKFNKVGKYAVKLEVAYVDNTGTTISENSVRKNDIVEVKEVYMPVSNLQGTLVKDQVNLSWERPTILPLYIENFENNGTELPADFRAIDEDGDKKGWFIDNRSNNAKSGSYSVYSESFHSGKFQDVSNWLMTGKIKAGAELLKFNKKHGFKERLDVYVVPAPLSGNPPTLDDIKAGHKVYSNIGSAGNTYKEEKVNIKQYTSTDNYIVFHHNTRKSDWGKVLHIDDIEVSYNTDHLSKSSFAPNEVRSLGVIDAARLKGYEIQRNQSVIANIGDINQLSYTDTLSQAGSYTYDVYAVYSDGLKSMARSITIQAETLSANEVGHNTKLNIYPNPSNGLFTIEAKTGILSLKAEVYDRSGQLIFKNEFKGHKAHLNLTQYPKGVYILNLVDNNGEKQSAKLIVR